jgi:TetR/AcrR family transcriptional regulator, cholesterol catabolism regulator
MFTEQQNKWLEQTEALFMRYGIKSITMDDVARELGISKKTLYQFVENKDDLVQKVLEQHIEQEQKSCMQVLNGSSSAIEEIMNLVKSNSEQLKHMKSNIIHDLQRYHREAWDKIAQHQSSFMYTVIRRNLERGQAEGLYRMDMDVDIITKIHIASSFQLLEESLFPSNHYTKFNIFKEYLTHYLYGIVSEKGYAILREKLS